MADLGRPPARAAGGNEAEAQAMAACRDPWRLVYDRLVPAEEALREALCTTGNGYFATRGAAPESRADGFHYPGTYANGVFNRLTTRIAGQAAEDESLVNLPNWLPLTFRVDGGPWFSADDAELLDYRQELDLRRGVLTRSLRYRDQAGRHTSLTQRRFASMDSPHLAALETVITAEDWAGRVEVRSGLDGEVANTGVARYRDLASRHLEAPELEGIDTTTIGLRTCTTRSRILIALAARTRAHAAGQPAGTRRVVREGGQIAHVITAPWRGASRWSSTRRSASTPHATRQSPSPARRRARRYGGSAASRPCCGRTWCAWATSGSGRA